MLLSVEGVPPPPGSSTICITCVHAWRQQTHIVSTLCYKAQRIMTVRHPSALLFFLDTQLSSSSQLANW
jgi:hypothetical protein